MLLSLVVIFTQSIQLSKIMERFALLRHHFAPSGGLSIPAQGSTSAMQRLNLKQTSLALRIHIEHANRKIMVELNGIEPLTPCLQSRCSPN